MLIDPGERCGARVVGVGEVPLPEDHLTLMIHQRQRLPGLILDDAQEPRLRLRGRRHHRPIHDLGVDGITELRERRHRHRDVGIELLGVVDAALRGGHGDRGAGARVVDVDAGVDVGGAAAAAAAAASGASGGEVVGEVRGDLIGDSLGGHRASSPWAHEAARLSPRVSVSMGASRVG